MCFRPRRTLRFPGLKRSGRKYGMCQRYRTEPVRDQEDKELRHHLSKEARTHANGLNDLLNPFALASAERVPAKHGGGWGWLIYLESIHKKSTEVFYRIQYFIFSHYFSIFVGI